MLSLFALAAASASSWSVPPPEPAHAKPFCQTGRVMDATLKRQETVGTQKLNELPNANMLLTVLRSVDGCSRPVIVRYDIGSAPKGR